MVRRLIATSIFAYAGAGAGERVCNQKPVDLKHSRSIFYGLVTQLVPTLKFHPYGTIYIIEHKFATIYI